LATSVEYTEAAKPQFVRRFADHYENDQVVQRLQDIDPYAGRLACPDSERKNPRERRLRLWFVAGYHPAVRRALHTAVKNFTASTWWQQVWKEASEMSGDPFTIAVSWKNMLPNLASRVGRCT